MKRDHRAYYEANRERILERQREYREANREKIREKRRTYYAANRDEILENQRPRAREYRKSYYAANREKVSEYDRAYRKANPEKVAEYWRAYNHARRARKRAVPSAPWTREQVLDTYGRVCWLCQYPLDCDYHIDHMIPLSRGGWDMLSNLRPAHSFCNIRKNAKMPPVIMQMRVWFELNRHLELMEAT